MSTAITNVRVFNGESLTEPKTVVIENAFISDKTVGDETIDGSGCTLLPGFIDSHIHLDSIDNLKQSARYGVTTMLDMTTSSAELVDSLRNKPGLTDIRSCYLAASSPKGMLIEQMGYPDNAIVKNVDDAERFVNEQIALGADYIKVIIEDPTMTKSVLSPEIITAIVNVAHKNNKRVFAHTTATDTYKIAIYAGVDVINHIPHTAILPQSIIDEISDKGIYVIPTMIMEKGIVESVRKIYPDFLGDFHNVEISVHNLHKSRVKIIAGTDSNRTNKLCYVPHGSAFHDELEFMVNAGLTPTEALQSATCVPAKAFGFDDRGVIEAGRRADLVLVEGDPTVDIKTTRAIKCVWINGIKVEE